MKRMTKLLKAVKVFPVKVEGSIRLGKVARIAGEVEVVEGLQF